MEAYMFSSEEVRSAVWEAINKRGERRGECLIWTGRLENGNAVMNCRGARVKVHKFVHEFLHSPINYTDKKFSWSCGNRHCFASEHVQLVPLHQWNAEEAMERIYSKGRRQEPLPDQKIGCWIWEGTINRCGYGAVWIFGRRWLTHMLSLMATEGITEIPTDDIGRRMQVRHKCKSKACCEPTHLELGTHDENMQDKFRDGTCIRGENHPNRGITEALAKEIKQSWLPVDDSNRVTLAERANRFGVSIKLVSSIDHGHAWAHVAGPNDEKLATKIVERKQSKRSKLLEAQKEGLTVNDLAYLRQRIYDKSTIQSTPGVADTPCRLWNGSLRRGGYGVLNYKYMQLLCYTTICEFKHGPRPSSDQVARHLCGNKLCVEQNHLQWGTRRENALDAINHGHLRTKLTAAKVKEIRVILTRDRSKGTLLKLCSSYGVTIHTIKKILYNQMWKH